LLYDEPERMLGLVVQVAAHLGQDLAGHVGEVVTSV
jgi:RNase P/RNase MRP subunit p29